MSENESTSLAALPSNAPLKGFDPRKLLDQIPELLQVADAAKAAEDKLNRKLNGLGRMLELVARRVGVPQADIDRIKRGET